MHQTSSDDFPYPARIPVSSLLFLHPVTRWHKTPRSPHSILWLSYDSLHIELPDGYLFFAPIVNWGKYRRENGRLFMPVTVRLNHAIADGYLVANVYRLLQQEIQSFVQQEA